jgi:hypothetical protein
MPLEVTIGAFPRERFGATLKFIVPKASKGQDGVTHVEIRAALARKPGRLVRAGYSAMAAVVVDRREDMLAVRKRYLKLRGGEPYVQVEMRPAYSSDASWLWGLWKHAVISPRADCVPAAGPYRRRVKCLIARTCRPSTRGSIRRTRIAHPSVQPAERL